MANVNDRTAGDRRRVLVIPAAQRTDWSSAAQR